MPLGSTTLYSFIGGMAIVIALIVGSYFTGFKNASRAADLAYAEMLLNSERKWREKYEAGLRKIEILEGRKTEIKTVTKIVKKEVKIYVEPDKDKYCGPSVGVVRLLNDARKAELSQAPAQTLEEGRAASGIGFTDLVIDEVDIIERYNLLKDQHNLLIEWIEENYGETDR